MATIAFNLSTEGKFAGDKLQATQDIMVFGTTYGGAGTTVEATYTAAADVYNCENIRQILINLRYVIASSTSMEVKFEWSEDGTSWFQEDAEDFTTAGLIKRDLREHQFSASGLHAMTVPKLGKFLKISRKVTGTADATMSMAIVGAVI